MKKSLLISLLFSVCASAQENKSTEINNLLDHKDSQLNLYLDLIKYNLEEKLGILPYILKKTDGTYLEIGTGGDPITQLLSKISDSMSPTIIASDIDQHILDSLPQRHPQLNKYLNPHRSGPKLVLKQLDATNMKTFENESLDGINASAIVHEIVSYAGGIEGLNSFFTESWRILKPEGVLIYRDPEGVEDKNAKVTLSLKTPSARLFCHIFLVKFLDNKYSGLATSGRKTKKYDPSTIEFSFFKKNESKLCSNVSYDEYLALRSYEIDFSRHYSINLPRGLCREIERHYLTYLHQCNPLMFVKCIPNINSESYFVNYLAHSTRNILNDFLKNKNFEIVDGCITNKAKYAVDSELTSNAKVIEYGITLYFASKHKEFELSNLLKEKGFEPNKHLIPIKDGYYLLDYRVFGLLFDVINTKIFDKLNGPLTAQDTNHAQWLKREGEENYIYYSDDELLTTVGKITHALNIGHAAEKYILCPISAEQNKFIPRLCYEEILKNSMEICDEHGFPIEIREGKRIIHFAKLKFEDAIEVYKTIIATNPSRYSKLQDFLQELQS